MFKSFTIALIPIAVIARGANDGSSAENALTVPMPANPHYGVSFKGYVHTWNAMAEDGSTRQQHGETELKFMEY